MNERRFAFIALIVTIILWGLSFISTKISLATFPPMSLGAIRFAIATVFLFVIKRASPSSERLRREDLPYLAGAGLMGVTSYFYFENNGVLLVSASEASIIIATIPILTMISERIFIPGVRYRKRRWVGAAISIAGVYLVAGATVAISGSAAGYLFMLGAAASWAAYCLLTRPLFARRSRLYIVFWQTVFGFIGFLPFAVAEFPRWGAVNVTIVLHIAYLGILCSALAYWLYAQALHTLGVATATIFVNLIPVITVIAGFCFLGERLSSIQFVGAAVVLSGVYLATYEKSAKPANNPVKP